MWSLFPQTSSSNLNNNVYTPPASSQAAPGIRGPGSGDGSRNVPAVGAGEGESGAPRGRWLHRVRPELPSSRAPAAAGGPEGLSPGRRARGRGMGAGSAPRCPRRRGSLAGRPTLAAGLRAPGPRPRASPPAPRITSGQIQRDVLLAAVIPPCAKQTHKPRLGSIAGRRRPAPKLVSPTLGPGAG